MVLTVVEYFCSHAVGSPIKGLVVCGAVEEKLSSLRSDSWGVFLVLEWEMTDLVVVQN